MGCICYWAASSLKQWSCWSSLLFHSLLCKIYSTSMQAGEVSLGSITYCLQKAAEMDCVPVCWQFQWLECLGIYLPVQKDLLTSRKRTSQKHKLVPSVTALCSVSNLNISCSREKSERSHCFCSSSPLPSLGWIHSTSFTNTYMSGCVYIYVCVYVYIHIYI